MRGEMCPATGRSADILTTRDVVLTWKHHVLLKSNLFFKVSFLLFLTVVGLKWAGLSLIEEMTCTNQDSAASDTSVFCVLFFFWPLDIFMLQTL